MSAHVVPALLGAVVSRNPRKRVLFLALAVIGLVEQDEEEQEHAAQRPLLRLRDGRTFASPISFLSFRLFVPNAIRMTGTPLSVVAGVTRAKLRAVTCTTSCAHRSPSPQLAFCSNPCGVPSPPPQVRVRARFPAAATAAATAAAHGGARRRRLRSVWVFFARARTTAAAATEVPRASFRGTLSSPPSPHDVTFPTRRVFTPNTTSRDVTRGRYGDMTAIRS